jgi:organic radical activating enzyme
MTKSIFLSDAESMIPKLGHGLCLAKWQHVTLHLPTGLNSSCYHPPLHQIDASELESNPSALHNTEHKKEQRRIMIKDERPAECNHCWTIEDAGNLSDRHYRSGEPWAAEHYEEIRGFTGDEDVIPSYVEVNFNHACNLKCSYCGPQLSSTWQTEVERYGAYPTSIPHNSREYRKPIPARDYNPYVEAFWKWWPELYTRLKHFRMTGGEPLMDRNTYRVFDYVLALPNPELHLNVTSNFSVESEIFEKYIWYAKELCNNKRIEHFMQYVSLDAVGYRAEYVRHGLNMGRLSNYVHRFLDEIPDRNSVTFIITMNNLSLTTFQDLLEYILLLRKQFSTDYQRVWFDTPVLRRPHWQSLQILPEEYVNQLEKVTDWMETKLVTKDNPYVGFDDFQVQRMRRNIDWMKEGALIPESELRRRRADFYRFFQEHDRRRDTNFLRTFPEMTDWWNECKHYARESETR